MKFTKGTTQITQKYFINKAKHAKTLRIAVMIGSVCLLTTVVLFFVMSTVTQHVEIPLVLGGGVLISFFSFYRTLFLIKLPLLIIDNDGIRYFNIFWYNKHRWDKFEIATFNAKEFILSIGSQNGRIFDRFMLSSLDDSAIAEILKTVQSKKELIRNT